MSENGKALTLLPRNAQDFSPRIIDGRGGIRISDRVFVMAICAVLMFSVLAFGAVEPWAIFILESAAAALFLAWMLQQVLADQLRVTGSPMYVPLLGIGALGLLQIISRRSVYRYATVRDLLLDAAYFVLFFVTVQTFGHERHRKLFGYAMTIFGFVVAVFAVVQDFTGSTKIYWLRMPRVSALVYGPYVDHSHYAGLMEMLIPIPLMLSMTRKRSGGTKVLLAFVAAFMAGSLVLSRSLAGVAAFVITLLAMTPLLARDTRARRNTGLLAVVVLATIGLLLVLDGGRMIERAALLEDAAHTESFQTGGQSSRLVIARDSLQLFVRRPIAGWGMGTFQVIYPTAQSFYSRLYIDHAHDDFLELLVETGAIGFFAIAVFVFFFYRRGLCGLDHWRKSSASAIRIAAMLGCTSLLIHSVVDFNLHIPANAAVFFVLCALGSTPLENNRRSRHLTHGVIAPVAHVAHD